MKKILIMAAFLALGIQVYRTMTGDSGDGLSLEAPTLSVIENDLINQYKKPHPINEQQFYLVYFSASWCGPSRKFTPILTQFYKKNKKSNNFEVIFVSNDKSDTAMFSYMKKMPWPTVKKGSSAFSKLSKAFGGKGIPNLVLVGRDGNSIASSYLDGNYVGPMEVIKQFDLILKDQPMAVQATNMAKDIVDKDQQKLAQINENLRQIEGVDPPRVPVQDAISNLEEFEEEPEDLLEN